MKLIYAYSVLLNLLLLQCSSSKTGSGTADRNNVSLENTYWKLVELNGQPISDAEDGKKELHLVLKSSDSTLSAFAGCNGVGGSYQLTSGNRLRFSNMISTLMACPELEAENAFKKALETVDNYAINGDELSLNKAKMAPLARFKATKK